MNVYRTIWLQPKKTLEKTVAQKPLQPLFITPIIIIGLSVALDLYPEINSFSGYEDDNYWVLLFVVPIGIGSAFLLIGYLMPSLIKLFGRIWKGKATLRQLANVCSLSFIPSGLVLIHQIVHFSIGIDPNLDHVNEGIQFVLQLWSLGLMIIGVAIVQKFSYGMALLNIFLGLFLPLLIVASLRGI